MERAYVRRPARSPRPDSSRCVRAYADLGRLTEADRDALAAAGVKLDIDLRTADEEAQSPDLL
ncbi:tyrosine-protein phosphatase, partial [Pseudomonas syringae group genomosp. 7]|uniref:tyrosine-protein phosphatase n=1 Tax=Pseudomonas syringae group genomosp. 7 TaxID=251699 RepID=UPI00376FFE28